jgi:plastocyanin
MSRLGPVAILAFAALRSYAATMEVHVKDAAGKPVADAAVYAVALSPADGRGARTPRAAAVEQADREFVPYVSVIQAGTTVAFPNRDPILHHVYSFSPAKSFEIKLYTGNSPTEVLFDKPGVVTLGCNIHDWMIAYIVVVPTAFHGASDAAGLVRLRDMPAGAYELRAWHPQQRAPIAAQGYALDASSQARAVVVVDIVPRKPKFKPPLERRY